MIGKEEGLENVQSKSVYTVKKWPIENIKIMKKAENGPLAKSLLNKSQKGLILYTQVP